MQRQLNEIVKHGLAAAHTPERADWTIDQGWESYTAAHHGVWKTLYERQSKLLPGRACDQFVEGMRALAIGADAIADFRRLSDVLGRHTGWQVVAVPGLVPDEVFFRETYFVIRNLDELLELAHIDFGPLYERVVSQSEFEPGDVLPRDVALRRGTGRYHAAKRTAGWEQAWTSRTT